MARLAAGQPSHPRPRHSEGTTASACAPAASSAPSAACDCVLGCLPLCQVLLPKRVRTPSTSTLHNKESPGLPSQPCQASSCAALCAGITQLPSRHVHQVAPVGDYHRPACQRLRCQRLRGWAAQVQRLQEDLLPRHLHRLWLALACAAPAQVPQQQECTCRSAAQQQPGPGRQQRSRGPGLGGRLWCLGLPCTLPGRLGLPFLDATKHMLNMLLLIRSTGQGCAVISNVLRCLGGFCCHSGGHAVRGGRMSVQTLPPQQPGCIKPPMTVQPDGSDAPRGLLGWRLWKASRRQLSAKQSLMNAERTLCANHLLPGPTVWALYRARAWLIATINLLHDRKSISLRRVAAPLLSFSTLAHSYIRTGTIPPWTRGRSSSILVSTGVQEALLACVGRNLSVKRAICSP